ncbi:MAG: RnfH family protein [Oceanococcaceae bacterium]
MNDGDYIRVEVAYALPAQQWLLALNVPAECSVEEAVRRSRLEEKVPGGLPEDRRYGIWSKASTANASLRDGDRIEIYRPLIADPKEARRQRAKKSREEAAD